MYCQMKEIYQTILELTKIKYRQDIQIIAIAPSWENNQPCWTYCVCGNQVKRDALWKNITS